MKSRKRLPMIKLPMDMKTTKSSIDQASDGKKQ